MKTEPEQLKQITKLPIKTRKIKNNDINFILSNWSKIAKYHPPYKTVKADIYFNNYTKLIRNALRSGETIMAVFADNPDVIYGFINYRGNVLNYLFVKKKFRNYGIGKLLFNKFINQEDPDEVIHTHLPKLNKYPEGINFIFNPFIFLGVEK